MRLGHMAGDKLCIDYAGDTGWQEKSGSPIRSGAGHVEPLLCTCALEREATGLDRMRCPGAGVLRRDASVAGCRQRKGGNHPGVPLRSPGQPDVLCDGSAVRPTLPRRPRSKAKIEAAVRIVEQWLLGGRLRHRTFYSLAEVTAAIADYTTSMTSVSFAVWAWQWVYVDTEIR